jgi:dUTP pyrophosphatase
MTVSGENNIEMRIVRLPHARDLPMPQYQSALAAGLDLIAAIPADAPVEIAPGGRALIPNGIAIALPAGHEGQIRPRSGLAARYGITVLNSPGIVDADYRGEVQVILINHGAEAFVVRRGMRVAQLVVAPVTQVAIVEVATLPPTERAAGGLGSTGLEAGLGAGADNERV